MSSRAGTQTAIERQIRRLAQRRGLSMLIAQKRNAKIEAHGGLTGTRLYFKRVGATQ